MKKSALLQRTPFQRPSSNELKRESALKLRKHYFKAVEKFTTLSKKDLESYFSESMINQNERHED